MYEMLLKMALRYAIKLLLRGAPFEEVAEKVATMYGMSIEDVWMLLNPNL